MVTQATEQAESGGNDIDRLRSTYDRQIADLKRQVAEERVINDDNGQTIAEFRSELRSLKEAGYQNEDPEVRELRQKLDTKEEERKQLELRLRQTSPHLKDARAMEMAYDLFPDRTDAELRKQAKEFLLEARDPADMEGRAKQFQAVIASRGGGEGSQSSQSGARGGDEFDAGRGSGKGGAQPITRQLLDEKMGDFDWWEKNRGAIDAAAAAGTLE